MHHAVVVYVCSEHQDLISHLAFFLSTCFVKLKREKEKQLLGSFIKLLQQFYVCDSMLCH